MKKIKSDSAKKNYSYQFIYQAVILIIPLITSPYLTRTLGDTGLGVYTYANSIAYYFAIFAMMGLSLHAQRVIAQRRNDEEKLRKTFWSLMTLHAVTSIIALLAYCVYAFCFCTTDKNIAIIQCIYVLSVLFDITWFFQGFESFKHVVIRGAIIRILQAVCIFVFIKGPDDTAKYTLIVCIGTLVGQLIMWPSAFANAKPIKFGWSDVKEHIVPMLSLFAVAVATVMYTAFDKTLLGAMTTKENVAYYEYANKIINIPKTFIMVFGTVLFPKASQLAQNGDEERIKKYTDYGLVATFFIGMASCFGLVAVGQQFVELYYGEMFATSGLVVITMCPLIIIIGLSNLLSKQYIYPMKRDKTMLVILICNAVINIVLSVCLIPYLGIYGAVIGTTAAELFGLIAELIVCRKLIKLKGILKYFISFFVIGAIMFVVIKLINMVLYDSIVALIVQILAGAAVFVLLSVIYLYLFDKNMRELMLSVLRKIKGRLTRKNKNGEV